MKDKDTTELPELIVSEVEGMVCGYVVYFLCFTCLKFPI